MTIAVDDDKLDAPRVWRFSRSVYFVRNAHQLPDDWKRKVESQNLQGEYVGKEITVNHPACEGLIFQIYSSSKPSERSKCAAIIYVKTTTKGISEVDHRFALR